MKSDMIQQKAIVIHETVEREAEHGFLQDLILRLVDKMSDWQIFLIVGLIVIGAFILLLTDHRKLGNWIRSKFPLLPVEPITAIDDKGVEFPPAKPKRRTTRKPRSIE